jgi:flavodoxin
VKKVLVAYYSRSGTTEKMAAYIAEGVRFSGNTAVTAKISELKSEKDFGGYGAVILGCPTYHKDITENFKTFLFLADKAKLSGILGGAFGPSTHSGEAPGIIFDTMEHVFKMTMTPLGPFRLMENVVATDEGMRSCQTYGKAIGDTLGA